MKATFGIQFVSKQLDGIEILPSFPPEVVVALPRLITVLLDDPKPPTPIHGVIKNLESSCISTGIMLSLI